jgi:hypothetical protein
MSKKKVDSQIVDELFYKWLSLSAKIAIKYGKKINTNEASQGVKFLGIESSTGASNAQPEPLIRNAYGYIKKKYKHKLARNIKRIYVDNNGNRIIK